MKTWFGVIIVTYKTNPLKVLILENKETGNITLPSGTIEEGETLEEAAVRELKEEVGWTVDPEKFQVTSIKQEFIYGLQKKERSDNQGINQVLLLAANNLPEPVETKDTKNAIWASVEEAKEKVTFKDLRDVLGKAIDLIYL